jgi:HSP20 family molecular chaperone IbpA
MVFTPRVDIIETDNELTLYADMPGVRLEDLDVRFENGELVLAGHVSDRHADQEFLRQEYGIGDFYRTFRVGESIDAQQITAELRSGVLIVHLPKSAAIRPWRIPVKSA